MNNIYLNDCMPCNNMKAPSNSPLSLFTGYLPLNTFVLVRECQKSASAKVAPLTPVS